MKTICALIAALLISAPAAADDWTREDTYRQAAYTVLHLARWSKARDNRPTEQYFVEGPTHLSYYETRRVGRGDINRDYALTLAAHFVVARLLPEDYREAFHLVTIGVQGYGVIDEHRTTVGFNLSF